MKRLFTYVLPAAAAAALLAATSVQAHHSFAMFDGQT